MGTYPVGYERDRTQFQRGYLTTEFKDFIAGGFAPKERLEVLRQFHFDPIDSDNNSATEINLRKAWLDIFYRSNFEAIQKLRFSWCDSAVQKLLEGFPTGVQKFIAPSHETNGFPYFASEYVVEWKGAETFRVPDAAWIEEKTFKTAAYEFIALEEESNPDRQLQVAERLARRMKSAGGKVILELSRIPTGKLETCLSSWIQLKKQ